MDYITENSYMVLQVSVMLYSWFERAKWWNHGSYYL